MREENWRNGLDWVQTRCGFERIESVKACGDASRPAALEPGRV